MIYNPNDELLTGRNPKGDARLEQAVAPKRTVASMNDEFYDWLTSALADTVRKSKVEVARVVLNDMASEIISELDQRLYELLDENSELETRNEWKCRWCQWQGPEHELDNRHTPAEQIDGSLYAPGYDDTVCPRCRSTDVDEVAVCAACGEEADDEHVCEVEA